MDTPTYEILWDGEPVPVVEPTNPTPDNKEIEMPKKLEKEFCSKCGSDNVYVDELTRKEWVYDTAILGDKEVTRTIKRVTCFACGHVEDK